MIGKTISHYKIIEQIGAGGMGVVYKAEDTKLQRTVALKFLPPELTRDPETKERFIREAQAASALENNNICNIHEIDETNDGQLFIVMACYEGETLKQKIGSQQLAVGEAIDIATQIAQGLEKAHEKGIIHRDIKPANILITNDGIAKILDFGLAKLSGQAQLTKDSSTLGTVAYMSPEQLRGEPVDQRTDIWSLGVVLYEMLTGRLPFEGDYEQVVVYSILNEEPILPSSIRKEIPSHFEQIVIKALEKDQAKRYKSMQDVLEELNKTLSSVTAKEEKQKSIVVLPFDDMSPNKYNKYFSDGLTEEIITDLSQIHALHVISRNSAMMLKGTRKATKTIGRELNVQYVLEGSVRKAGNNLRITAQLIDANTDTHLWAEKYSGTLEDVFDIQEKVSRLIVDTLKIKLTLKESNKISERPIDNVQAYECWLKARQAIFDWTENSLEQAAHFLETGLEILGENAVLFAGLGFLDVFYFNSGMKKDPRVLLKAEDYFNKAFQLDPDVFLGNYGMGFTRHLQGINREAIRHLRKAIDIDPNNADSMRLLCYIYGVMIGNDRKAAQLAKIIIEVDPLWPINYLGPVFVHWTKGELKKALEACKKYYQMAPKNIHARFWYAEMLAWNNRWDEASDLIEKNQKDYPEHTMTKFHLFFKYSFENRTKDAIQTLSDELLDYAWYNEWYSWMMAESYALINKKSESLKWLQRMIDLGHCNYPLLSKLDPFLENIRGEARFKKLMERVKYDWENFEV
jgi:serine/threonine protein kinase/cytochrome c-type biogenesis protein CcmH/NrfG